MTLNVDDIRGCLEGGIPGVIATCAVDGVPNITLVSQVHRVDRDHIALSFQFFNKTRENILANPQATVQVIDPETGAKYRLSVCYERTESEGALFESMKAKLAGIASLTGMTGVFMLRGSDIYRVLEIHTVPGPTLPRPGGCVNLLSAMRRVSGNIARHRALEPLLDDFLADLDREFGITHSMLLLCDQAGNKLYAVATRGYSDSGIGAEIPFGAGVIGVSAQQRTPIGISYMTHEYAYSLAVRDAALAQGVIDSIETEIPFPGLPSPHSQLAVPIVADDTVLGVIYVESAQDQRFGYDEEDALAMLASQLGTTMAGIAACADADAEPLAGAAPDQPQDAPTVTVRRYVADNSIFIGDDYLIKGVAGAILWKLLSVHQAEHRDEFSNRELRLDASLRLPDIVDNLEARLILLTKRLAERCDFIRIEKTGRGRFRLRVGRPLRLEEQR
ncbi:GAF domain-containing protein [Sinimarinibacterium sp. CAU 1509]|uniref:GAF domain-containing protein n=1 Tax=Sinimarinibacterium sp. CAU 1509 TaxID=2562283 RepID=UPI0010ACF9DA|nr:GAF domain-containing protein [Sinimarinibacterium sp. CAU 1509]TJY59455.1 GAF domain-containing protein [Sinimarinibacterium sp. CAU 1509]